MFQGFMGSFLYVVLQRFPPLRVCVHVNEFKRRASLHVASSFSFLAGTNYHC